jgi:hypothetical protein
VRKHGKLLFCQESTWSWRLWKFGFEEARLQVPDASGNSFAVIENLQRVLLVQVDRVRLLERLGGRGARSQVKSTVSLSVSQYKVPSAYFNSVAYCNIAAYQSTISRGY